MCVYLQVSPPNRAVKADTASERPASQSKGEEKKKNLLASENTFTAGLGRTVTAAVAAPVAAAMAVVSFCCSGYCISVGLNIS